MITTKDWLSTSLFAQKNFHKKYLIGLRAAFLADSKEDQVVGNDIKVMLFLQL